MTMSLDNDFSDLLQAFSEAGVEYIIVGAHAMAFHGYVRSTGDFDVWVHPTAENAARVIRALTVFGAPVHDISAADLESDDLIFQIGVAPLRIDIITSIDGLSWDEAMSDVSTTIYAGVPVNVLGRASLIANKRSAGRPKDLLDVVELEKLS